MKNVIYLQNSPPYWKGNTVNLPDATADALVKKGVAEYEEKPASKTKTEAETPTTKVVKKVPEELVEK